MKYRVVENRFNIVWWCWLSLNREITLEILESNFIEYKFTFRNTFIIIKFYLISLFVVRQKRHFYDCLFQNYNYFKESNVHLFK